MHARKRLQRKTKSKFGEYTSAFFFSILRAIFVMLFSRMCCGCFLFDSACAEMCVLYNFVIRARAKEEALSAAKKQAEDEAALLVAKRAAEEKLEADHKTKEAMRMAAIVGMVNSGSQNSVDGVVKGSVPSKDCQSFPVSLKDPSMVRPGEEFDFLKKDYDVPRRVAAHAECTGVSMNQIISDNTHSSDTGSEDIHDQVESGPRPRSASINLKNEHNILMKEKLDAQLDKAVNVLEAGSFFELYKLGEVVSAY